MQTIANKQFRRTCSTCGWSLVIYYVIMSILVQLSSAVGAIQIAIERMMGMDPTQERIYSLIYENALGYHAAIFTGLVLLLCWKGIPFWKNRIWAKKSSMSARSFFRLLAVFLAVQTVSSLLIDFLNYVLGYWNIDIYKSYEIIMENQSDSMAMFLYAVLLAPISEEILFRGLILRSLSPYGNRFAIVASAFLFGMFHGNLVQMPYAFALGIVLGYVASEYSLVWAIVLHAFNNLVLGDMTERLSRVITSDFFWGVYDCILWAFTVAGVVVLISHRKAFVKSKEVDPISLNHVKAFFLNMGVLTFLTIMTASLIWTLFL